MRSKAPCLVLALAAGAAGAASLAAGEGFPFGPSSSFSLFAAQSAESVVVEREKVEIRDMAASYGEVVATAKKSDRLAVVARKGKWLNVRTKDGRTGWVSETSLAARSSGVTDTFAEIAGRRDAKTASGSDDTTAAKGGEEFDKLAKARGWDKDQVYEIERRTVDPAKVRRFAEEGKLGPSEEGGR